MSRWKPDCLPGLAALPAALLFAVTLPLSGAANAGDSKAGTLPPGLYEIEHRLELPHLERYSQTSSIRVCLGDGAGIMTATALPVIGANGAFDGCKITEPAFREPSLSYRLVCRDRDSANAVARYTLSQDGYTGRIDITLGAKNMTMTEVQSAKRIGDCRVRAIEDRKP